MTVAIAPTPIDWGWKALSEVTLGIYDCPHSTPRLSESGPYMARTQDIGTGCFRAESAPHVSLETYHERISRAEPRFGDLLYSREGTYFGVAAEVPPNTMVCLGQRMVLIRPNGSQLDHRYLRYWLNSPAVEAHVAGHKDGSVAQRLNLPTIRQLPVPLPPLDEQRGIAATLGALDDKIESNRRVLKLEYLLAVTLLSGPGEVRIRVGAEATVCKGLSYKGAGLDDGSTPGAIRMLNLANFTTSGQINTDGFKYYTGDFKPAHILSELELVVANTDLTQSREILGRGFLVSPSNAGSIHTHHTSVVRFQNDNKWMALFLWAHLQSPAFRGRAKGFATGTTVTALPAEAVLDFELNVPSDPSTVTEIALLLLRHGWQLLDEIESLAQMRDVLLPELLSGRIRVPEAEQALAEVDA